MDTPKSADDVLRSRISSARVHLTAKLVEAESVIGRTKSSTESALLPVARGAIVAAQWTLQVGTRAWEGVKRNPELVGGSFLSLTLLRVLGWRARAALVSGLAAAWLVWAPDAVSTASKLAIKTVQDLQIAQKQ
jgi:hypothetical protein